MFPVINIGPLAVDAPGLIILLGIWLAVTVSEKYAPKFDVQPQNFSNAVLIGLVGTVVAARLAYVFIYFQIFLESPLSIVSLNTDMFDFFSGAIIGGILVLIYLQRKKIPLWPFLDSLTPGLAVFAPMYFFAQFASGDLYGASSSLPWAVDLWGTTRHPLQLYYLALSLLILYIILRTRKDTFQPGTLFFFWLFMMNICVIFLDAFKGYPAPSLGNFQLTQIIAWGLALLAVFQLRSRLRKVSQA